MKEHAGGYVTTKSEQGPTVHSALHSLYWPVAIRVCLSFLCSFIQSTNTKAYPGFSTILGSRKSCKDKQGKTSALKQLTVSCAVNKKQKETECSMGRDRVNSGGLPGCPATLVRLSQKMTLSPFFLTGLYTGTWQRCPPRLGTSQFAQPTSSFCPTWVKG